ncbi:hypothetical protein CAPTEDRAFT_208020 [Capitella teleta]|uniref:Uncharacterized protein n=1 Tax=Capitella teleta TaxID=283909 RepID=R7VKD5_CAPTE|nr:hypothetical protein CAPTEDRAFT_208020 [Capitella teleta]|eukprot:ELU17276.1 hypothetical protein CAPTEDRAFT_208020 [Capitella teleta]
MTDLNENEDKRSRSGSQAGGIDRVDTDPSAANVAHRMLEGKGADRYMLHPGESLHASTSHLSMSGSALHLANIGKKRASVSKNDDEFYAREINSCFDQHCARVSR